MILLFSFVQDELCFPSITRLRSVNQVQSPESSQHPQVQSSSTSACETQRPFRRLYTNATNHLVHGLPCRLEEPFFVPRDAFSFCSRSSRTRQSYTSTNSLPRSSLSSSRNTRKSNAWMLLRKFCVAATRRLSTKQIFLRGRFCRRPPQFSLLL